MIKKVYSKRHHPGWKFDGRSGKYVSWAFDIRLQTGRRRRVSGFLSRHEAEAVIAKIRQTEKEQRFGLVLDRRELPTFVELVTRHLAVISNRREHVRARRVLTTVNRLLPTNTRVIEITSSHLQNFVDLRTDDGLNAASVNRELNIVSAALNAAPNYFPSLRNWQSPRIPRPKSVKRRRERVISASEVLRIITWLYAPQRDNETGSEARRRRNVGHVFRTALLTGARKGELCKLRWDHVDWGASEMQIVGTKTEHRSQQTVRYLTITETLAEILRERECESTGPYVFTRAGGEVTHYYRILTNACESVGVPYGRHVVGGFVTHDARHTAVTRMLQAGRDLATIGSITGHTDKTLILHYGHASKESRDRAMDVLEEFAGNETLGRGLDSVSKDALIYSGIHKGLVPEVGLEPT